MNAPPTASFDRATTYWQYLEALLNGHRAPARACFTQSLSAAFARAVSNR